MNPFIWATSFLFFSALTSGDKITTGRFYQIKSFDGSVCNLFSISFNLCLFDSWTGFLLYSFWPLVVMKRQASKLWLRIFEELIHGKRFGSEMVKWTKKMLVKDVLRLFLLSIIHSYRVWLAFIESSKAEFVLHPRARNGLWEKGRCFSAGKNLLKSMLLFLSYETLTTFTNYSVVPSLVAQVLGNSPVVEDPGLGKQ